MRAVVCHDSRLTVREQPSPDPQKGQLLLNVKACGICGSDLHARQHTDELADVVRRLGYEHIADASQPFVLGHEICGEVVESPGLNRWKEGDLAVAMPMARRGKDIHMVGFSAEAPGGFADRVVLEQSLAFKVPNGLPANIAALTEPMAVGLHAVRRSEIGKKDVAIVIGCGPVGLAVISMLKASGVRTIVASDFSRARRMLAVECGADIVVDPQIESPYTQADKNHLHDAESAFDLLLTSMRRLRSTPVPWQHLWRAADAAGATNPPRPVIFECVGVPGLVNQVIENAPLFSRVIVVGVCMETDHLKPAMAINKEIDLRFVFAYTPYEFRETLHLLAEGKVQGEPLITSVVGLYGVEAAFDALGDPEKHAKILVDPSSKVSVP